jgi:AraC-like DNA-binding protein
MQTVTRLDAHRVRAHRVLSSACRTDSQRGLAAELVDHRLTWGPGAVDTRFSRVRLEHLSMAVLHYGAAVEVQPEPLREFVLVQMPLQGRADIAGERGNVGLSPRTAGIVSPNRPVRLRWEAGCEQLLIKIPLASLRAVARSGLNLPERALATERFEFAPRLDLESDTGRAWSNLVDGLLRSVPLQGASNFHVRWRRQLEESAMLFLLAHQPSGLSAFVAGPGGLLGAAAAASQAAGALDPLDRLQAYIAQRLCAPVSLLDLSRAAGIGVRSLHSLCRERLHAPPMTVLRQARLDAVRRQLLRGGLAVTEVALAHGFEHLGRFSAYYRARFGELPSATGR